MSFLFQEKRNILSWGVIAQIILKKETLLKQLLSSFNLPYSLATFQKLPLFVQLRIKIFMFCQFFLCLYFLTGAPVSHKFYINLYAFHMLIYLAPHYQAQPDILRSKSFYTCRTISMFLLLFYCFFILYFKCTYFLMILILSAYSEFNLLFSLFSKKKKKIFDY